MCYFSEANNLIQRTRKLYYQQFRTCVAVSGVKYFNLPVALVTFITRAVKVPTNLILAASCGDLSGLIKLHAQLLLMLPVV